MSKRILKLDSWLAAIMMALALGVAAGGGAVYALTQNQQADTDETVGIGEEPGILVASVVPDSPAAAAGIERGDIVLKVGDTAVNRTGELISAMQDLDPDNQTEIRLMHGDEERILPVTLADRNGRAYLGVVPCGGAVPRRIAVGSEFHPGATIVELVPDGPAEQAGMQQGDIITAVDGQEIALDINLAEVIGSHAPGDAVTLTIEYPGEEAREVTITLGENPNEEGAAFLGVTFRARPRIGIVRGGSFDGDHLPFDMPFGRDFFGPGEGIGSAIIIRSVTQDGPASTAGLTRGSMITMIDGEPVGEPDSLAAAVEAAKPGDTLTLTVKEPGVDGTQEITVTLGEDPNEPDSAYLGVTVGGFFGFHQDDGGLDITEEFFVTPEFGPRELLIIPEMGPDERAFDFLLKDFSMEELEHLPFFEEKLEFEWCDDAEGCLQFDGSI